MVAKSLLTTTVHNCDWLNIPTVTLATSNALVDDTWRCGQILNVPAVVCIIWFCKATFTMTCSSMWLKDVLFYSFVTFPVSLNQPINSVPTFVWEHPLWRLNGKVLMILMRRTETVEHVHANIERSLERLRVHFSEVSSKKVIFLFVSSLFLFHYILYFCSI